MCDGNLEALRLEEQRIEEAEKQYEVFLAEVEDILYDSIETITKIFNGIAEDNYIDMTLLEYLQNR